MIAAGRRIEPGADAPNFDLPDERGLPWSLSGQLETSPVMLIFYRGDWCPFANGQLAMLSRAYDEFARRGTQMVGVTVDPPPANLQLRNKLFIPFTLLSDARGEVAATLGLWESDESVNVPAVVIVDRSATARYVHVGTDTADHPSKEDLLDALRALPRAEKRGMSGPEVSLDAADAREGTVRRDLPPFALEELLPFYEGALSATRALGERLRASGWSGRRSARETERYALTLAAHREAIHRTLILAEGE